MVNKKRRINSTIMMFATAIIWGFAFVAQNVGSNHLGTFSFNGLRFLLGAICLIPVVLVFERSKDKFKETALISLIGGTVLAVASNLQQYGIGITDSVGKASFLTGLYTIMVPVLSVIFLKRRTSLNIWIGAILGVIALYLICVTDGVGSVGLGDIILIVSDVLWAVHILIVYLVSDKVAPLKYSMMQFFVCGVETMICAFIFEEVTLAAIADAAIPILYCGVLSVGVAYTLQVVSQRDADPTSASIIFATESLFGAIGGAIILHEVMTPRGYIGCAVMFAGIIISQIDFGFVRIRRRRR